VLELPLPSVFPGNNEGAETIFRFVIKDPKMTLKKNEENKEKENM
jgi:hypothetical protein